MACKALPTRLGAMGALTSIQDKYMAEMDGRHQSPSPRLLPRPHYAIGGRPRSRSPLPDGEVGNPGLVAMKQQVGQSARRRYESTGLVSPIHRRGDRATHVRGCRRSSCRWRRSWFDDQPAVDNTKDLFTESSLQGSPAEHCQANHGSRWKNIRVSFYGRRYWTRCFQVESQQIPSAARFLHRSSRRWGCETRQWRRAQGNPG